MKTIRLLSLGTVFVVACAVLVGCSKGPSEEELARAAMQEQIAGSEQLYEKLTQTRTDLAAARATLAELEGIDERKRTGEQKALIEELTLKVSELTATQDAEFEELQGMLAESLNTGLNEFPDAPETDRALEIYSEEALVVCKDMVIKAGDYKKAIDHLSAASSLFEQAGLKPYQPLLDKIAELDEWRYITQERFDAVKNGMTKEEVKAVAGVPYYQNIQVDEKRGVETWLYKKRQGGAAAFYFKTKTNKIYSKKFDAIKTQVVGT